MIRPIAATCAGLCHGGPWDGQRFVHYSRSFTLFKPMMEAFDVLSMRDPEIKAVAAGEYVFFVGQWIWHETTTGRVAAWRWRTGTAFIRARRA